MNFSRSTPTFAERFGARTIAECTLDLTFPFAYQGGPPAGGVLVQRATIKEAVSRPWSIAAHVLSVDEWEVERGAGDERSSYVDAHPEQFLGKMVRFTVRAGEHARVYDGVITGARHLGHWHIAESHHDRFDLLELTIESALRLLEFRRCSRVFHDRSPIVLAEELILEHRINNPTVVRALSDWPRDEDAPPRSKSRRYLTQYKETDLALFHRLLAHEGINYVLRPDPKVSFGERFDFFLPEQAFGQEPEATLGSEPGNPGLPLRQWRAHRRLVVPRTRLSSPAYDGSPGEGDACGRDHGIVTASGGFGDYTPVISRLAPDGAYDYPDYRRRQTLDDHAALRQWEHDLHGEVFDGETTAPLPLAARIHVQGMVHARHTQRDKPRSNLYRTAHDYIVLRQEITACTPLHPQLRAALARDAESHAHAAVLGRLLATDDGTPRLLSRFRVCPVGQPIVPPAKRLKRTPPGALTATVVNGANTRGPAVHTDAMGRIAVRMHWQRPHDGEAQTHHKHDTAHPVWLRYVQPGAGDGIGFQYLPRVGDEVLVVFLDDDPDRPVAIGSLHGQERKPPRFGQEGALPLNAALTGMRTQEHEGAGGSELCMDDTRGEVGVRLATSTAATSLTMGHIATPRQEGKATHRGTGVELRTEGAATLRAAEGMLLTTYGAAQASEHLAHAELADLIQRCHALTSALAAAVEKAGGLKPSDSVAPALDDTLKSWKLGAGKNATAPAPIMALAAAQDIIQATPASQLFYAGGAAQLGADGPVHIASGEHAHISAGQGITLHALGNGADLRASAGPITVAALQDAIRVDARKTISIHSHDDEILITGRTLRFVAEDGSFLRIGGGIQAGSPGDCTFDTKTFEFRKPSSMERPRQGWEGEPVKQRMRAAYHDIANAAFVGAGGRAYTFHKEAERESGDTDPDGFTAWTEHPAASVARLTESDPSPGETS